MAGSGATMRQTWRPTTAVVGLRAHLGGDWAYAWLAGASARLLGAGAGLQAGLMHCGFGLARSRRLRRTAMIKTVRPTRNTDAPVPSCAPCGTNMHRPLRCGMHPNTQSPVSTCTKPWVRPVAVHNAMAHLRHSVVEIRVLPFRQVQAIGLASHPRLNLPRPHPGHLRSKARPRQSARAPLRAIT